MINTRKYKRLNENAQARDKETGRFRNTCGALIHDDFGPENGTATLFDLVKRPSIKSEDYKTLLAKGIINDETKYICGSCFQTAVGNSQKTNENTNNNAEDSITDSYVDQDDEDLIDRCIDLGKEIRRLIVHDIKNTGNTDSIPELKDFNPLNWLTDRPMPLLHLLCSISNVDINTVGRSKIVLLSKIVELLYYTIN